MKAIQQNAGNLFQAINTPNIARAIEPITNYHTPTPRLISGPNTDTFSSTSVLPFIETIRSVPPSKPEPAFTKKEKALVDAISAKDFRQVQQAIEDGANVRAIDPVTHKSILNLASLVGEPQSIYILLNSVPESEKKDFVNQKNPGNGQTALFSAALANNGYITDALLAAGADTTIKDNAGKTAYDFGKQYVQKPNIPGLFDKIKPTKTLPIAKDDLGKTDEVNQALDQILADPEGQKMIELLKRKGYTIEISNDPSSHNAAAYDDGFRIVVNPDAPHPLAENFTAVLAHEMVHAITPENNDSFQEESTATVLGNRIAKRASGHPPTAEEELADYKQIYAAYKVAYKDVPAVKGRIDNGIFEALQKVGIDVNPEWKQVT